MNPDTELPVAVRAYAENAERPPSTRGQGDYKPPGASKYTLIFDTETTTDATQQLRFGCYQVRKNAKLIKAGFFYDEETLTKREQSVLINHAERIGWKCLPVSDFIVEVFLEYTYYLGGLCVGFNLPFDLSRIAINSTNARTTSRDKMMHGGFSLKLTNNSRHPSVQVKHLSRHSAFIRFTVPEGQMTPRGMRNRKLRVKPHRGHFADVATLANALLSRSRSLGKLADHLRTKHRKLDTDEHGRRLTREYLRYAAQDVQVTWECFEILQKKYADFGLTHTAITGIYSEASIGKGYLQEMGVPHWLNTQPNFPKKLLGVIMSTYYGGRSEVHIRRRKVRVLHCDFASMYPTVNVLMRLWQFVIAGAVDWRDATAETQAFIETVSLDDLRKPDTWLELTTLVKILPQGDLLPVRAEYEKQNRQYSIGLNQLCSDTPMWYTLADCIASKILTGRVPNVIEAVRFAARSTNIKCDLLSVDIMGNPAYHVDPNSQDFFKRLIELRREVNAQIESSSDDEDRLKAEQLAIKICANATSYGIYVELNVTEHDRLVETTCYGCSDTPFTAWVKNTEEPGKYFHPIVGTFIAGAARLMLAMAESLVEKNGLSWAFCDTDSMAIAMPDSISESEFIERAQAVRKWFNPLNPYEGGGDLLKLEDANKLLENGKPGDDLTALYCFAVSAKRYALFNVDSDGLPIIRKASGHGLGHLWHPYKDADAPAMIPAPACPDEIGVERWQYDLWYLILLADLEGHPVQVSLDDLPGLDKPAVSRYAATTKSLLDWFKQFNEGKEYRYRVKPFNFLLAFHNRLHEFVLADQLGIPIEDTGNSKRRMTTSLKAAKSMHPIAPYRDDPFQAAKQCFDRKTGQPIPSDYLQTYQEVLHDYHLHAEAKFNNGERFDSGFTLRKSIQATRIEHIGKETDRWEEQWFLGADPDSQIVYADIQAQWNSVMHDSQDYGTRELARASGLDVAEVSRLRTEKRMTRTLRMLMKLQAGIIQLRRSENEKASRKKSILDAVKTRCQDISVRHLAELAGVEYTSLTRALTGKKKPSVGLLNRLEAYLADSNSSPDVT